MSNKSGTALERFIEHVGQEHYNQARALVDTARAELEAFMRCSDYEPRVWDKYWYYIDMIEKGTCVRLRQKERDTHQQYLELTEPFRTKSIYMEWFRKAQYLERCKKELGIQKEITEKQDKIISAKDDEIDRHVLELKQQDNTIKAKDNEIDRKKLELKEHDNTIKSKYNEIIRHKVELKEKETFIKIKDDDIERHMLQSLEKDDTIKAKDGEIERLKKEMADMNEQIKKANGHQTYYTGGTIIPIYHYTDEKSRVLIEKTGYIKASTDLRLDAVYGPGVYFTSMSPFHPNTRKAIYNNNWPGMNPDYTKERTSFVFEVIIKCKKVKRNVDGADRDVVLFTDERLWLGKVHWKLINWKSDKPKVVKAINPK